MDDGNTRGAMLQQRFVPFPTSISMEAQAVLARLVREDGTPFNSLFTMPDPEDRDAWMRIKAAVEAQYVAAIESNTGSLRSSVETIEIDKATIHVATPDAFANPECALIDLHGGALVIEASIVNPF